MNGGFRIGKLFGIEIILDFSWIFIFLLVTWNLAFGVFPRLQPEWNTGLYWIIGVSTSLLFFASVLAHELAHSLVAKMRGLPIKRITLFLFGGVSNLEKEPESARTEFIMAIAGPATSIILGFLFIFLSGQNIQSLAGAVALPQNAATLSPLQTIFLWLGPINIILGLFNLLPGFPLDGGRIFRSAVWSITNNLKTATKIAAFIGQGFGYLFIATGLLMIFGVTVPLFGTGLSGLWIAIIGWFLTAAAGQSYQQVLIRDLLSDTPVKDVMRQTLTPVAPTLKVKKLVDEYLIGTDKQAFPVMTDGKLEGMVSFDDVQKIPRNEWDQKKVNQIMTPYQALDTVNPSDEASEVLTKIAKNEEGQVPVISDKQLVGIVSRRDILLWIALQAKDDEFKGVGNNL